MGHLDKAQASIKLLLCLLFITFVVFVSTAFFVVRNYYFPQKYRALVIREAKKNDLDPFFVAALIFKESSFRPKEVSSRGAIGLMQLLPSTIVELERLKLIKTDEVNESHLYIPTVNVRIGALYLDVLTKRVSATESRQEKIDEWYDGNPILPLLFSYNAGPTVILQKYFDHSTSPEEFSSLIKKNRPSTWKYAQDILSIQRKLEWFDEILYYD